MANAGVQPKENTVKRSGLAIGATVYQQIKDPDNNSIIDEYIVMVDGLHYMRMEEAEVVAAQAALATDPAVRKAGDAFKEAVEAVMVKFGLEAVK